MAASKKIKLKFEIDGINTAVKNMEDLERVTEELNEQLKQTEIGTEEFDKLSAAIAQTSTEMQTLEAGMEGLNPEARASAFGAFAGGMAEAATGAAALSNQLGITNESSLEMVETIASGMAVAQSFKGGIEGIIAVQKILKTSTIAQSIATKGGAVAQGILNAVMMANPIFLLIAALTAFIALIAIFASGTNEAAEEAEELNATLEDQAAAYEEVSAALDRLDAARQKELDNNSKLLQSEIDLIKSKGKLTEADKERIAELEGEMNQVELDKFDSTIDTAQKKFGGLGKQIKTQFSEIDSIIKATDYEDGINDINYDPLTKKNAALKKELETLLSKGFTEENVDKQIAAIEKLKAKVTDQTTNLSRNSRKLGDAEKEVFEDSIESSKNLNKLLTDLVGNATDYKNALGDKEITKALQETEKQAQELADQAAADDKARTEAEARRKEYLNLQKKLKSDILSIEQELAILAIDQTDLAGQEEAALLKRQQQFENEMADVEGNSERALELRKLLTQQAEIEMENIRKGFAEKRKAEEDASNKEEEARQLELIDKAVQGEHMLADMKIAAMQEGFAKETELEEQRYQDELTALQESLDNKLLTEEQYFEAVDLATQQHNANQAQLDQDELNREQELQDLKKEMALQATMGLLGGINDLVQAFAGKSEAAQKKAFKVNKAFQIAQATIDTIKGGVSAFTGMVSQIPGPVGIVLGAVAAAGVVASGVASIKKIADTKFQGTGGGGATPNIPKPSAGSGGAQAPQPPSINLFGQANEGSEGGTEQGPGLRQRPMEVKAVVVESDITNTQNRLNTYQQRSEIG